MDKVLLKKAGLVLLSVMIGVSINVSLASAEEKGSMMEKGSGHEHHDHADDMKGAMEEKGSMAEAKGSGMGKDAMMAKWMEISSPNENHKVLESLIGEWDHVVKWWDSPEMEPQVSKGSSKTSWIMGGRFIQQDVEGEAMGQPFQGMGITGYDNVAKKYISTWIDTMSTGMMKGSGQYDAATNTLTEEGIYSCPFKGDDTDKAYKTVITFVDENTYTYEMYSTGPMGGDVFRTMEITYTKKQ